MHLLVQNAFCTIAALAVHLQFNNLRGKRIRLVATLIDQEENIRASDKTAVCKPSLVHMPLDH